MGRFIAVQVDPVQVDPDTARRIVRSCPVDIFKVDAEDHISTRPENEDECILCARCVEIAPEAVEVRRCYGTGRELIPGGSNG